jgi:drug/metabolite transporter (DMT)-like permease
MPYLGEIAALITAVLWSITSIVFTEASLKVGSLLVNVTRLILAFVYLTITILVMQFDINMSFSQFMNLAISGFIGLVFGDGFLFKSFQYIGARISMLIMALVPAMSTLMAFVFLGETITFIAVIGIFITLFGIAIVVLERGNKIEGKTNISFRGIFYGFLGAVGQAVGIIFAKQAFIEGPINGFVATQVRIVSSLIFFLPLFAFVKQIKHPVKIFRADSKAFLFTSIGSLVGPFLGITFSLIAISNTKVGVASTLMATVPIIMLPLVHFYYKEKLTLISIFGALIAVFGIALLFVK